MYGADFYLLQQVVGHIKEFGAMNAPNQFTRFFSPGLTLPFLLLPIWMLLEGRGKVIRGGAIALNLYVYPHHLILLGILELCFWVKNKKTPDYKYFILAVWVSIPFVIINFLVYETGLYSDFYARVGTTNSNSAMWYFLLFFAIVTLLSFFFSRKDVRQTSLAFNIACFISALFIYVLDNFLSFPQVHLVELRVFAYLAPVALVAAMGEIWKRIPALLNIILTILIVLTYAYSGWDNKDKYNDFNEKTVYEELKKLPEGSVIMTDIQHEIPYISAIGNNYSYLAYSIVSAASDEELLTRFAIASKVFNWSDSRIYHFDWDGLLPVFHWIFHHGFHYDPKNKDTRIETAIKSLDNVNNACDLLGTYKVDYIRIKDNMHPSLTNCTTPISKNLLKVIN
ncbi:hypothetical protein [Vibrio syngnathi]|uniref:Uncharacterized protein n=1 Tax=Vibrio syngnathi TaxID=3034029 RepID=A0AA34TRL0_9VIBR|nr:hypothetical protein [Vibrio syngnathi]ARP39445.1 hypothetical protein K08M4_27540 [Vibrio syngnathi]